MSVTEKIHRACELCQAGRFAEALGCLDDAQKVDPWNGYLIDLTERVERLNSLAQQKQLSAKDQEDCNKWLPGILQRIDDRSLTRQPFQASGRPSTMETSGDSSTSVQKTTDAANSNDTLLSTVEDWVNKQSATKPVQSIEPLDRFAIEYEHMLKELAKRQELKGGPPAIPKATAMPMASQDVQGSRRKALGADDKVSPSVPGRSGEAGEPPEATKQPPGEQVKIVPIYLSEEDWKKETEGVPDRLEYGVIPSKHPLRRLLIICAILAPFLIAGGVFYFISKQNSEKRPPVPLLQDVAQPPQTSSTEKKSKEAMVQPQKESTGPIRESISGRKESPTTSTSVQRRTERRGTAAPRTGTSSYPVTATAKPLETPSPAKETPVVTKVTPAPIDTIKTTPTVASESPQPAGPHKVTVRVYLDSEGKPIRAEIINSTNPSYNNASIEAVMKSTFPAGKSRTVVMGFIYP